MTIGTKGTLAAGVLAALGASACCAGPLILLLLGVGGGWASRLIAFEPYSPYFTGLTLLLIGMAFYNLIGMAFYNLYVRRRACAPGEACAADRVIRNQRIAFWFVTLPVILLLAFPLYAPAMVQLDVDKANIAQLAKATADAGFPSTVRK
jgi:mercuric ion transport protein